MAPRSRKSSRPTIGDGILPQSIGSKSGKRKKPSSERSRGLHDFCVRIGVNPALSDLLLWSQIGRQLVRLHPEIAPELYCTPPQARPRGGRYKATQAPTNVRAVADEIEAAIMKGEDSKLASKRIVRKAISAGRLQEDAGRSSRSKAVERELQKRRRNEYPNSPRNKIVLILAAAEDRSRDKN